MSGGLMDAISRADVVSQTEHEYMRPMESQFSLSLRCCAPSSSRNSRCAPYVSPYEL